MKPVYSTKTFPITPTNSSAYGILAGIGAFLFLSAGAIGYFARRQAPGLYTAAAIEILAGALVVYLAYSSRRTTVELDGRTLRIRGTMFGKTIDRADLLVEQARLVDLSTETDIAPKWKLCGVGLPSYQAGWFTLRKGGQALVFLTRKEQTVYIPTRKGYPILVNVTNPAEFLQTLQANS